MPREATVFGPLDEDFEAVMQQLVEPDAIVPQGGVEQNIRDAKHRKRVMTYGEKPMMQGNRPGRWVQSLSKELFWDVHQEQVNVREHLSWIVERVLTYGKTRDWSLLIYNVPKRTLNTVAPSLRLRERERVFLSNYLERSNRNAH
jgi:hypothetical protein